MSEQKRVRSFDGRWVGALAAIAFASLPLMGCGNPIVVRPAATTPETSPTDQPPAPPSPPPPQTAPPETLPPVPKQGNAIPSPVDIPDIFRITAASWSSESEAYIRSEIDRGCGELGPACVDFEVVVDTIPEYITQVDCPVLEIRIPRPIYNMDVADTPHRDDLITIAINDPCDGVIVSPEPQPEPLPEPEPAPAPEPQPGPVPLPAPTGP